MTQYNRIASVTIGRPGAEALLIRGLRIVFDVQKTDAKEPNTAKVKIYNLSEASRNLIKKTGELLYLSAGYSSGDGEEILFIGDISDISHSFARPDIETTIICTDGSREILEKRISVSFGPGASGIAAAMKILTAFEMGNDLLIGSFRDKKYANGFSFCGRADVGLSKVASFLGLDWSIQNHEIKFIPGDGSDLARIVSLSPTSGLLGAPERMQGEERKRKGKAVVAKPGWKLTSLLRPKIIPGCRVMVTSEEISGAAFKVSAVSHSGDTNGNDWVTVTEVRE